MKKNNSLLSVLFAVIVVIFVGLSTASAQTNTNSKHQFPQLQYAYNALEPSIDAATMEVHYSKHFRTYYDNFIKAIAGTEYENLSMEQIFAQISKAPIAVRNMGGGYYNHQLFFENLSPQTGSPSAELTKAIVNKYESLDAFKAAFNKASASVFGSGWVWLIKTENGSLDIVSTPNQDNPLMDFVAIKGTPLIAFDVWEHAYYLKYQNRRMEYINSFWNVVNWNEVNKRFAK